MTFPHTHTRTGPGIPVLCAASGETKLRAGNPAPNLFPSLCRTWSPREPKSSEEPDTAASLQNRVCPVLSDQNSQRISIEPFRTGAREVCWGTKHVNGRHRTPLGYLPSCPPASVTHP